MHCCTVKLVCVFALLLASCAGPDRKVSNKSALPSNLYKTMYASSFVDVLRAGGKKVGAFDVSRQPAADGLYHLRLEIWEGGKASAIDVALSAQESALSLEFARNEEELFPSGSELGSSLLEAHRLADRMARKELGETLAMFRTVDLDFATQPRQYLRLDDLHVGGELGPYSDLGFERDGSITMSAVHHRNVMRLGIGSEDQFRRLASALDWTSQNLTASVEAAGIEITASSNTDYWSPMANVGTPAGAVFAVRSRLSSRPTALMYVRSVDRDGLELLLTGSPIPTGLE
jgi:hypothetical protein